MSVSSGCPGRLSLADEAVNGTVYGNARDMSAPG